ncbi:MAG: lysine exporter LysO family protein [Alistipes finegoldii]
MWRVMFARTFGFSDESGVMLARTFGAGIVSRAVFSPIFLPTACEPTPAPACPASDPEKPLSMWDALKGSLVIVAFFVAGCVAGLFALVPFDVAGARVSTYVLYALMFCVGVTLGHDETLAGRVRRLDPRLALLPVMTAVGTLAGAALATPLLPPLAVTDTLAVGSGFGYYSLSSIFIADFRGAELGTVALLCNVMREIFTLLAAPLVVRWCGPLAAVSIGGATTFDTTLPVITQAAGKPYAVVSIFHGCTLDFSVPFLVTFFCTL